MTHKEAARLHCLALCLGTAEATEAAHEATKAVWQNADDPIIGLRCIEWSKVAWATRGIRGATWYEGHQQAADAHAIAGQDEDDAE